MSALGMTLQQIPRNGWHETRTRIQQWLSVDGPNETVHLMKTEFRAVTVAEMRTKILLTRNNIENRPVLKHYFYASGTHFC
jgi:hypothetical protein